MLIVSKNDNEVLKSVKYLFDQERLEYDVSREFKNTKDKIIIITDSIENISNDCKNDLLIISDKKRDLSNYTCKSNIIITKLVSDNNKYTKAQEEYLFRKGIYSIINNIVLDFISDKTIDKMIYDISSCKLQPTNWIFDFDSITETYEWLSKMNRNNSELKVMDLSNPNTYNTFSDSDKEINYLSEYILLAKKGMKISTIFIVTKDVIKEKMNNIYFDLLARKSGDNVKTYFCDVTILEEKEPDLLNKIRDGVNIYEDCVYRDTYDSEITLGVVDCKLESVKEYTDIFNYIVDNYSTLLVEGGEYVEI